MAEAFLGLSAADRADALGVAATATGRPVHVLEKDVWVVWMLDALFAGPDADHLVFKGGTSLSKAFGVPPSPRAWVSVSWTPSPGV